MTQRLVEHGSIQAAERYRDALDALEGMPRAAVYPSGRPVPEAVGRTDHVAAILEHPTEPGHVAVIAAASVWDRHDGENREVRGQPVTVRRSDAAPVGEEWRPDAPGLDAAARRRTQ